MKEYVSLHADGITCRREYLLNYFDISKDEMKHNCCDLCAKACSCGELSCPANLLLAATTAFDEDIWKRDHAVHMYKTLDEVFNDMDPIPDNFLPSQKENDNEESDEDEWYDLMNDTNNYFADVSITDMDMSSFDLRILWM
ncbi:Hypothetical predicted protein [Paramuricea clavata]|uniref:Uncharacterized protein n=1 Tax=Paramuricea clavata TaxID=317549 RepID=A0A7D9KCD3_PARCT|nr:Hypothetical predicted protein [Paramuricea clavata]